MKKAMLALSLALALCTPTCKANAYLKGKITNISRKGNEYVITCQVTSKSKWQGHIYSMSITKGEWYDWRLCQGKIKRNTKVAIFLDTNGTENVYDDEFFHVHKVK